MEEPFGFTEAMIRELTPKPVREHSPWFDCLCETCVQTRDDVAKYGFNDAGGIAYPRAKPTLPWENAA